MGRSKRFIAAFLAVLMMMTPAMEVYATNTASVSVNSPVVSQTESTEENQEEGSDFRRNR